jgi:hypothetical protein
MKMIDRNRIEDQINMENEIELLKNLCKELLNVAQKFSQSPFFIVQPFFGIVKRHSDTINKHNLL